MLIVGKPAHLYGDVTQLKAIGAKSPENVEIMLGYHPGRLSGGYWICLLQDELAAVDFELAGTTLRSGGKLGAPELHQSDDNRRVRVHDQILADHGAQGYANLQNLGLSSISPTGAERLVKIVPVIPHMKYASPAKQYPMGGGALQWTLKKPGKMFLVAASVNAQGLAQTPDFSARVDSAAPYDDRARLYRYLETQR